VKSSHVTTTETPKGLEIHKVAKLLNPSQVARLLGVTPQTVCNWNREGKLPTRVSEGRIFRFALSDIVAEIMEAPDNERISSISVKEDRSDANNLEEIYHSLSHPKRSFVTHVFLRNVVAISSAQVATILQTTPQTINAWHRDGIIPGFRVGGVVRYDWNAVDQVLSARACDNRKQAAARDCQTGVAGFVSVTTTNPMKTSNSPAASVSGAGLASRATTMLVALGIQLSASLPMPRPHRGTWTSRLVMEESSQKWFFVVSA
jgi:DNA-binding transcriptional regulator YiaG